MTDLGPYLRDSAHTPPDYDYQDLANRLRTESAKVLPRSRKGWRKSGLELWAVPAADLPGVIKDDHARWQQVVREANIKAD